MYTIFELWHKYQKRIQEVIDKLNEVNQSVNNLQTESTLVNEIYATLINPVSRPLLLEGFTLDEIHTLVTRLGEFNVEFAPVYTLLEEDEPDLWLKYQRYIQSGGTLVETLWQKYHER